MLGLNKDIVQLVEHDPEWKEEFKKEKAILKSILGDKALEIEHVGSTSIPGLMAKPILDIAVAVKDKKTLLELESVLANAGYDMKNSFDKNGELLARKGTPDCRTHYIHLEIINSQKWQNHILFRDYLIKYPKYIAEYQKMKEEMQTKYADDRKSYTANKNAFIEDIMEKARREFGVEKAAE